ncbi:hypothetical protein [Nannocystis pusilla]|uniref:hypothetical protein n=1 Tax=Nannocystis pusilla TaxID=889268 RepID=UPI003B803F10
MSVARVNDEDLALRQLIEVLAVPGGAGVGAGNGEAAHDVAGDRVEGDDLVVAGEPHRFAVEGDAVELALVEGQVLARDLGGVGGSGGCSWVMTFCRMPEV